MHRENADTFANLVRLAQKFQQENGAFLPFGEILEGGELKYQTTDEENIREAISRLDSVYREKAAQGSLQWAALCTDVRLSNDETYPDGTDAIHVAYEDQDGQSVSYFVPYQTRADGAIEYQPSFARPKVRCWFT